MHALVLTSLALLGVLGVAAQARHPAVVLAIGLPLVLVAYLASSHRDRRRRRLERMPLSERGRETLREYVAAYNALSEAEKKRFEAEISVFLGEQTITGLRGAPISESTRVLVAASAVLLVFGHRGWRYPPIRDVVVYPDAFDDEYRVAKSHHVLGQVHAQGPILISERALKESFEHRRDGFHVGLHEFAHVLDLHASSDLEADGVPVLAPWSTVEPWLLVVARERKRAGRRPSILREYAATNPAEFFAVATEAFFERPKDLFAKHPDVYRFLAAAYQQDPAAANVDASPTRSGSS